MRGLWDGGRRIVEEKNLGIGEMPAQDVSGWFSAASGIVDWGLLQTVASKVTSNFWCGRKISESPNTEFLRGCGLCTRVEYVPQYSVQNWTLGLWGEKGVV